MKKEIILKVIPHEMNPSVKRKMVISSSGRRIKQLR